MSSHEELHELAKQVNLEPRQNFERKLETPYPIIDTDPHFKRVVGYFRGSDYFAVGLGTAVFPGLFYLMERTDPTVPKVKLPANLKFAAALGAVGGFLFAYQASSKRFWGWSENEREVAKDNVEMSLRIKEGKSLYGNSSLDTFYQQAAANNSRYSALKFGAIPWFNFVNHPFHGKDPKSYSEE